MVWSNGKKRQFVNRINININCQQEVTLSAVEFYLSEVPSFKLLHQGLFPKDKVFGDDTLRWKVPFSKNNL